MKTIFSVLVITLTVMTSHAQNKSDSSRHLTFKGVPINGTLNEYVSKMKASGFSHSGTVDGIAFLKGDFASYKGCTIGVSTLKQMDLVSKIAVLFPNCESWPSLSSNYFDLKSMLIEKYGEPANFVEEFQSFTPDNDGMKLSSVQLGHCKYYSSFETGKGTIQLSIDYADVSRCFVKLVYFDKINSDEIRKGALNDL